MNITNELFVTGILKSFSLLRSLPCIDSMAKAQAKEFEIVMAHNLSTLVAGGTEETALVPYEAVVLIQTQMESEKEILVRTNPLNFNSSGFRTASAKSAT